MRLQQVESYPKANDEYWTVISLGNAIAISFTVNENGECNKALISDMRDGIQFEIDFLAKTSWYDRAVMKAKEVKLCLHKIISS